MQVISVFQFDAGASFISCIHVNTVCRPAYARLHTRQESAHKAACQRPLQATHVPLLISAIQDTLGERGQESTGREQDWYDLLQQLSHLLLVV